MTDPLHVALVGYGYVGRIFHAPLIRHTPGLRLHAIVSRQAAQVQLDHPDVQLYATLQQMLDDPQIALVVVATPNDSHADIARAALRAGKHVLVDKPFTVSAREAADVLATARACGRIASVFQNRRWDADFLTVQSLLQQGTLGRIAEFHSHLDRHRPKVRDRWREGDGPGAGLWFDLGPHLLDQALQLFGRPQALQADLLGQRDGARGDDYFHVTLHYPRMRAHLHAGSLVAANGPRFVVHGSAASFVKQGRDPQEAALRGGNVPGAPGWGEDPLPGALVHPDGEPATTIVPSTAGDYRTCYAAMRDAIGTGSEPPITQAQAQQLMELLELAMASAHQQRMLAC